MSLKPQLTHQLDRAGEHHKTGTIKPFHLNRETKSNPNSPQVTSAKIQPKTEVKPTANSKRNNWRTTRIQIIHMLSPLIRMCSKNPRSRKIKQGNGSTFPPTNKSKTHFPQSQSLIFSHHESKEKNWVPRRSCNRRP